MKETKKTTIGGQALLEGILMRGPSKLSIAVRDKNGEIILKNTPFEPITKKYKILGLPIIRGAVALIEALTIGIDALMYSAEFIDDEEESEQTDSKWGNFLTILFSIAIAIVLFMIIPNLIAGVTTKYINSPIILNLIEGIIRLTIFAIYLYYISKLEEINRTFEYHGAEHKSIHCYENYLDLTVENVKKFPIMHKRCGTSFLFMVMIISIVILSFFGWPNPFMRIITRIIMFPIIAGVSYEVNRFIGKRDSKLCNILAYPGLLIQKYVTVKEPHDDQIEVAIAALKEVLPTDGEDDNW
ncbi:MAG: DUF1385 domain-containing protein [Tissierellia bacterium]|nr:DUF1385 domain-containing protein [Tissierellia bacterium]